MANKRIRVSDNGGTTYFTLPGNQGEKRHELNQVEDTVFGQAYQSQNPTLAQFNFSANGLFKGVAGYQAVLKKGGTATTMTAEACTLVSGKTYQITAATKRVIDYNTALTVFDNAVDKTAFVQNIDYLNGTVTFLASYTVTGPVTLTGKYLPMAVMAKARGFNLTQTQSQIDGTVYEDAQANNGHRTFGGGLKTIGLEISHIFAASNSWLTQLLTRGIIMVEIDLDAANPGLTVFRGFFKAATDVAAGNQGDVETETITLSLYMPDGELVLQPFNWYISGSSKLNSAVVKCLTAFTNQSVIKAQYLPSGATGATPLDGIEGDVIVTECSLANAIDGQNEFSFAFRGTGAPTAV